MDTDIADLGHLQSARLMAICKRRLAGWDLPSTGFEKALKGLVEKGRLSRFKYDEEIKALHDWAEGEYKRIGDEVQSTRRGPFRQINMQNLRVSQLFSGPEFPHDLYCRSRLKK